MLSITLRPFIRSDFELVANIYAEGIDTGLATFETQVPDWKTWNSKYIESCRFVALISNAIVGFGVLSAVSHRAVYKGVAEVSVYVSKNYRGQHIGEALLRKLIDESENQGFWTLQAGIFSENLASINLHKKCGFRVVGIREKVGQLNGKWHDNHFLEKRSQIV